VFSWNPASMSLVQEGVNTMNNTDNKTQDITGCHSRVGSEGDQYPVLLLQVGLNTPGKVWWRQYIQCTSHTVEYHLQNRSSDEIKWISRDEVREYEQQYEKEAGRGSCEEGVDTATNVVCVGDTVLLDQGQTDGT